MTERDHSGRCRTGRWLHAFGKLPGARAAACFFALVLAGLPATAGSFELSQRNDDYFVIKGGWYYPRSGIEVADFTTAGSSTRLDRKDGFVGEIAVGHYFAPLYGVELGSGYFESKASPETEQGEIRIRVLPVQVSGKVFLPIGSLEPYGALGIGAYVTKLEVNGNQGSFTGSTRITYGFHGGVGVNVYLTETFFIGIEGRYTRARPEFGRQPVRLNGYTATIDLGFRY